MASRTVARAGAAAGAAAVVSAEANCDAGGMTWELVAPTEIDETVAMISPGHSAGALLALGRELARDPRLQEVVGEPCGLRSGPASILAPPRRTRRARRCSVSVNAERRAARTSSASSTS